jgi:hypothetical protein
MCSTSVCEQHSCVLLCFWLPGRCCLHGGPCLPSEEAGWVTELREASLASLVSYSPWSLSKPWFVTPYIHCPHHMFLNWFHILSTPLITYHRMRDNGSLGEERKIILKFTLKKEYEDVDWINLAMVRDQGAGIAQSVQRLATGRKAEGSEFEFR